MVCQGLVLVYGKCSEFTGKEFSFYVFKNKTCDLRCDNEAFLLYFFETGILSNQG